MRSTFKRAFNLIAAWLVLPAVACYRAAALLVGPVRAFPGWSQALGLLPGLTGLYLRRGFYGWALARCEADVSLDFGTVLTHPGARLGRGVFVGCYCVLGEVDLEDDVLMASHVSVINGGRQHGTARLDVPVRLQPGVWQRITIGRDSWIGERAVVMADVGRHCVVGAGAVVTRPLPDYAIAVGVPARVVGYRNAALRETVECPSAD